MLLLQKNVIHFTSTGADLKEEGGVQGRGSSQTP